MDAMLAIILLFALFLFCGIWNITLRKLEDHEAVLFET